MNISDILQINMSLIVCQFSVLSMILVIPVAVKVFYPIYHDMQLTSCYEYLGVRFGKEMRLMGAILYIVQMCFYTSVSVLAPAIALSKATGLNTRLAIVLIYVVCVFYSSQGGLKAVIIADNFQVFIEKTLTESCDGQKVLSWFFRLCQLKSIKPIQSCAAFWTFQKFFVLTFIDFSF